MKLRRTKSNTTLQAHLQKVRVESKNNPLTETDAMQLTHSMRMWLPHILETVFTSVTADAISVQNKEFPPTEDGVVGMELYQQWGSKPDPEALHSVGTIIEFGGPTTGELSLHTLLGIDPDAVTNVAPTNPSVQKADATSAPYADNSIGTAFYAHMPGANRTSQGKQPDFRPKALAESYRILQSGGRLVWVGGTTDDIEDIITLGFIPEYIVVVSGIDKRISDSTYSNPNMRTLGVFIKQAV